MPLMGSGYLVARESSTNTFVIQRYGGDGQAAGSEATIALPMGPGAWLPTIAPLAGGGYAAMWLSILEFHRFGGSIYAVVTQSFTNTGAPIGSPLTIAETEPARYWYPRPAAFPVMAALAGGGYVVVWGLPRNDSGVYAQRFTADGTPDGAAQQAAVDGSGYLGVTGLATGGYMVTWGTGGRAQGGARAYGADGMPLGPAQSAGPTWSYPVDGGSPALAALAGGGAVMTWMRNIAGQPSGMVDDNHVQVLQFGLDATPVAASRSVDDSSYDAPAHLSSPSAAGLQDGGYLVAWIEAGELHARRFAASGTPVGAETRVNLVSTDVQHPIAAAAMAGGGFMISWSGVGVDGIRSNYARVFPANGLLGTP